MNRKVLIVDDDPAMLRLLEKYLAASGYEVLQATNGQEALKIVLSEEPPIVVTDWVMPEIDGVALCRMLRQHEGVRFVYIIIVTAHSDYERIVEAFDAGVDDFLSKPISKHELLARMRAGEHIARLEADLASRAREVHRLNAAMAVANDKLELANDQLKRMATTDSLTGLINRRAAMDKLHEMWETAARYDHGFSCIMLDIDHFKSFNDTHGHAVGDAVLHAMGSLLQTNVRMTDKVCRIGGEEFLVLCPNISATGAAVCAEHLRAAVEAHDFPHKETPLKVTISLGIAEWSSALAKPDELLKIADDALYASKDAGRNRVTIANEIVVARSS